MCTYRNDYSNAYKDSSRVPLLLHDQEA